MPKLRRNMIIGGIFLLLTCTIYAPTLRDNLSAHINDLDGNLSQITFIAQMLQTTGHFPQWNFFINQGIPVLSDPLSPHLNPLILASFFFLNPETAVKFLYVGSIFSGALDMYWFMRRLAVRHSTAFILTATYIAQGYTIAHMVAGHIEKIVTVGIAPWSLACMWITYEAEKRQLTNNRKHPQRMWIILSAALITAILFSGDLYGALYLYILVVSTCILFRSKAFLEIIFWGAFLGAAKILPLYELSHHIGKIKEPFEGSQNLISMMYYFFVPVKGVFHMLGIGKFLETGFAWWEKISTIGPAIAIGLVAAVRKSHYKIRILFTWLGICTLLAMPAAIFNPYHWLIIAVPALQVFHVPSRIFGLMSILFIVIAGVGFEKAKLRTTTTIILIINVALVIFVNVSINEKQQLPYRVHDVENLMAVVQIQKAENQPVYIAQDVNENPLPQSYLIHMQQKILNSNYGLQLKDSPATAYTRYDFGERKTYSDIAPAYEISNGNIVQHSRPDYINVDGTVSNISFSTNSLSFQINSKQPTPVTVYESSYPGWRLHVDNRLAKLSDERFLTFTTQTGIHAYTLEFYSYTALLTLGITCIAWSVAIGKLWKIISH